MTSTNETSEKPMRRVSKVPIAIPAALLGLTALLVITACGSNTPNSQPTPTPTVQKVDDATIDQARYECLLDAGFAVTRDSHGAIVFTDPQDKQTAAYQAADKKCTAQLVSRGLLQATTKEDMRAEYKDATKLHDCLAKAGLPVVPWMSWETFQDRDGQYDVLEASPPITFEDTRRACPREMTVMEQS